MAILINERVLIIEPVKCGTTHIRRACQILRVPHRLPPPVRDCCPRHSPADCYNRKGYKVVGIVRHPVSWAESFWRHMRGETRDALGPQWRSGTFFRHDCFYPCPEDFGDFVRSLGVGKVSHYFRDINRHADWVMRQDRLESDLLALFAEAGVNVTPRMLRAVPMTNVSKPVPCDWPGGGPARLAASEYDLISRCFGGNPEPPATEYAE